MEKLNVVVLYGGYSSEHEVSKLSASTVISNMSSEKYNIIPVYITLEGKWLLYDGCSDNISNIDVEKFGNTVVLNPDKTEKNLLRIVGNKVKNIPVDIVFPVLHGKNGEDGAMQGLLEISGIPYVGCGVLCSAVSMDKVFTKKFVEDLGIKQAEYISFVVEDLKEMADVLKKVRYKIGYPCFVKPANSGSSVGISKAKNKKELEEALEKAALYDRKIVVEKAVVGRELECAILGVGDCVESSGIGEIITATAFYDYDAKYNDNESRTLFPDDIPEDIADEIKNSAKKIFKALDGSGLSRVDFFLEEGTNKVIFNEINTMPGFTCISMYPMLWQNEGVSTSELIDRLIEYGLSR